jgi:hypothetical protein
MTTLDYAFGLRDRRSARAGACAACCWPVRGLVSAIPLAYIGLAASEASLAANAARSTAG